MPARSIGFRTTLAEHRWWLCAAAGVLLFSALPENWSAAVRAAVSWIVAVGFFLGWTASHVATARPDRLRLLARREDPKRWVIFILSILAATASLIAVTVLLRRRGEEDWSAVALRIILVAGVVLTAWLQTHTMFALHYAHIFYGDGPMPGPNDRGGLLFPGADTHPDFLDFLYFSLVLGMTCQVSDVQITGRHMRRLASIHGVLSFFFNTVILAITVNLVVNAF